MDPVHQFIAESHPMYLPFTPADFMSSFAAMIISGSLVIGMHTSVEYA